MQSDRDFWRLVASACEGDSEAMNHVLALGREKALRKLGRNHLRTEQVQDLAQEFTVRLWSSLRQLREPRGFWRLVWRVCGGVIADAYRKQTVATLPDPESWPDPEQRNRIDRIKVDGHWVERSWLVARLPEALDQLKVSTRHLFAERLAGHPLRSLASVHRVSEAAIKTRLHRGRRRLRSILTERIRHEWCGREDRPEK